MDLDRKTQGDRQLPGAAEGGVARRARSLPKVDPPRRRQQLKARSWLQDDGTPGNGPVVNKLSFGWWLRG